MMNMKKIYLTFIVLALVFVSCDMDKLPEGTISDTEAYQTVDDCEALRNGLYAYMRSITTGNFVILSDIQLDDFHAVRGNGNRLMDFYNGDFKSSTDEIRGVYSGFYSVIASTNYVIEGAGELLANGSLTDDDCMRLNRYIGEAHFIRAFCYNGLADKFCESYKNAADVDADASGLSLQTKYAPTGDNTTYPGRSTLRQTYALITRDLEIADSLISLYEEHTQTVPMSMSAYITSDVAKAMQARVYLNMGENAKAASLAESLIATERYPLTPRNAYKNLWTNDEGSEVLWRVEMDINHQGSATGRSFASATANPDYIPTNTTIYLFDLNDVRWDVFFGDKTLEYSNEEVTVSRFAKYPGNPLLYTSSSNYSNMSKPFRSAELYLIAAEANFGVSEDKANFYLSTLQSTRIIGHRGIALTGDELLAEIYDERHREYIGEGFRFTDLKRWNLGFKRSEVQEGSDNFIYTLNNGLEYESDDYRFLWPIPKDELDSNPQIKDQQNPGY
jgi:hypothetical protein